MANKTVEWSDQTIGEYPINLIIRLKSGAQKLSDDYELDIQRKSKTLTIIFFDGSHIN